MINHHPDENLLLEYATGSLAWGVSLGVLAHIQMCQVCSHKLSHHQSLGGVLLNTSPQAPLSQGLLDSVLAKIQTSPSQVESVPEPETPTVVHTDPLLQTIPAIVRKLLPKTLPIKWNRVSADLKTAYLESGQNDVEVAFQRIGRGGRVVEHGHRGMEYTLVLAGSFSDESGAYVAGDFLVRRPGDVHRPTATLDQDCLCLSVVEAPVKITGWLGWFINPFLRIHPA